MPQDGRVASITLQTAVDLRVFTEYPKPAQLRLVLAFHVSLCFAFLLQDTVKIVSSHHLRQLRADTALKGPLLEPHLYTASGAQRNRRLGDYPMPRSQLESEPLHYRRQQKGRLYYRKRTADTQAWSRPEGEVSVLGYPFAVPVSPTLRHERLGSSKWRGSRCMTHWTINS